MSNLDRWDPFSELTTLQKHFFGDDWMSSVRSVNIPTTDVFMQDDNLVVEAHLPNFEKDDIDIEIENNALIISAERHEKDQDKSKKYVVRESSSSFYRRIALPKNTDLDNIEAHLDDGVLKVSIPIEKTSEAKKITVKSKKK